MSALAGIYGAVIAARNSLYDSGRFRSETLDGPVISVGNLSVGGAGKTPFVIMLGELLKQRGIEFDVLSRGYGRQTSGVLEVDPNGSPREFGDEPLLIARSLDVPVTVAAKRAEGGRYSEQRRGPRLHLLDDGFQHRQLRRDFDIVLVNREDLGGRLLPVGKLREPVSSLERADVLVSTNEDDTSYLARFGKPVWHVKRSVVLPANGSETVVAFCGIARPERFFSELEQAGVRVAAKISFRDHKRYSASDMHRLVRAQQESGAAAFITTAKDAINLGALQAELHNVAVAEVRMELENSDAALDLLLRTIERRHGLHSATERRS